MKLAYGVYSVLPQFMEKKFSVSELGDYIDESLASSRLDRVKLDHNERGKWEFSVRLMHQWCDDNNVMVMPNPKDPHLEFWSRIEDNKAFNELKTSAWKRQ